MDSFPAVAEVEHLLEIQKASIRQASKISTELAKSSSR